MTDKLDFLLALARERHFGRAADTCGVTQPTLSAGIKQIERQMGVRLVNRGSRFQSFTPEGEKVLEWARRIVGDTRAMRAEINALRHGLTGRLRIAAIPTALAMVASLTTPFRERHPNVRFTIMSRTSIEVLEHLENLEIDAGVTYLDNEPLGRVTAIPLYRERYRLITSSDAPLGDRASVTWAEVAQVPLCLLTPNMQNRRIIEGLLRGAGGNPQPTLESNSMIVLFAHVRTGRWASVMPSKLAETLGLTDTIRAIPIAEPEAVHEVGLVVPAREPMTALNAALVAEARKLASTLDPLFWRFLLIPVPRRIQCTLATLRESDPIGWGTHRRNAGRGNFGMNALKSSSRIGRVGAACPGGHPGSVGGRAALWPAGLRRHRGSRVALANARSRAVELARFGAERQADMLQQGRELLTVMRRMPEILTDDADVCRNHSKERSPPIIRNS